AFNVYMAEVKDWGIAALHRAIEGVSARTAVHICYGYGIKANIDWKQSLGGEWRQYEEIFPALAKSPIDQVSLECLPSGVPIGRRPPLGGRDVRRGPTAGAGATIETRGEVAAVLRWATAYVAPERPHPCTNCGRAPMDRRIAQGKLEALAQGTAILR